MTSFVGRRGDVAEVKGLLSSARLVSLVGQGGVGKTRLVLRVGGELRRAFSDGVWFVELADLPAPEDVVQRIAADLHLDVAGQPDPLAAAADQLRDRRMLLILDNCEHLLDAVAAVASELLRAAPHLRILTTSRQPLRITGERLHAVLPLDVPDPNRPLAPGAATQIGSMALFVERAQAVVPTFRLTPENEPAVARLCRRLDGVPLAIELAAVSLRVLSVQELLGRLDERFDVLTSGPRSAPGRHQTLEASIRWSYDLCTSDEKSMWAACAIFAGQFDRAAAEAVCSSDEVPPSEVLGVLAGLVDKSILSRDEVDGIIRFRMSAVMREFGLARLDAAGSTGIMRARHTAYFSNLLEQASDSVFGPQQEQWLLALLRDHANLQAVFEHTMDGSAGSHDGLRLASKGWVYWIACGELLEGRHWLDQALFADTDPTSDRARALWVGGLIAILQGDRSVGDDFIEESAQVAAACGDDLAAACAIHVRGIAAMFAGDTVLAITLFDDAARHYRDLGTTDGLAVFLELNRGLAHLFEGDHGRAVTLIEEARRAALVRGERWVLSSALEASAMAEFVRGETTTARALIHRALQIKRPLGDVLGLAIGLDVLGWIEAVDGDASLGAVLLGSAHRIWESVGEVGFGSKSFAALRATAEDTLRRRIGEDDYAAAYLRGGSLDPDRAVALALGEPATAPGAGGSDPAIGLTPRESQVAELVGRGLSNKEIAATLVISQRTAEGHVQRILTKFGFTSRAQVATWVAEQRPAGSFVP